VFAAGDLAYPDGSEENFADCYDPTWGRHRLRMPSPGNHEFHSGEATPYFRYFGAAAGEPGGRKFSLCRIQAPSWPSLIRLSAMAPPRPSDAGLHLKLRDDPSVVSTVVLPVVPERP
jgi:hypothetical protein